MEGIKPGSSTSHCICLKSSNQQFSVNPKSKLEILRTPSKVREIIKTSDSCKTWLNYLYFFYYFTTPLFPLFCLAIYCIANKKMVTALKNVLSEQVNDFAGKAVLVN